ncbi:sulfite exporter TauE/SafE family protein [Thalassotalea ponticola]|uniref:sulfite exporter TauE/SafE family protein n=1 Tax=Thalassotalea ponticola TaxID=1523392 RepID=UPI0025B3F4DD|nr:sulfite exporter TauE/SafE family protein [Thalassotalea ponticola]MDN3653295.1 sulfite exporter TauE/SafE family protein [Thalassotalea ponticola]
MISQLFTNRTQYIAASLITVFIAWGAVLSVQPNIGTLVSDYFAFFFLGIGGAIAANSTGAGGGVVFVPFFDAIGMHIDQVIATSFAIQCFGMTVGSISWLLFFNSNSKQRVERVNLLYQALLASVPFSIAGLLLVQYLPIAPVASINLIFSVFSLVFGIVVLYHCAYLNKRSTHRGAKTLTAKEVALIAFVSFIGGIITAWISVGVGEIVAVILLIRGFSVMFSVATGVIVSAISVICGVPYFIELSLINTQVLMFAAPGAMVGALLARYLALWLGAQRLKLFLGSWILLVGIAGIA